MAEENQQNEKKIEYPFSFQYAMSAQQGILIYYGLKSLLTEFVKNEAFDAGTFQVAITTINQFKTVLPQLLEENKRELERIKNNELGKI